jgi:DNA invertase Pin-like site-specific DNA recombinase
MAQNFALSPGKLDNRKLEIHMDGNRVKQDLTSRVERVKAGLRNAKAKGKTLGRPRRVLDTKRIAALRAQGVGWKKIAAELGVGVSTIHHSQNNTAPLLGGSKTRERVF